MPLGQYQLMALDSLQHEGPYGQEPWKEKSLEFYFKDRFSEVFQDPHNGYIANSLVEGYYSHSENTEKDSLSFYTNLNRGFLYQFGIIQDYIAEKDRHHQTPAQTWQESCPSPEDVKKIQNPKRLSVVEKIKNWAWGLDKEET
ncbi:MAG: hypothetical protein BGO07_03120 [Alphaproteobacteria bacterium 40-19]|nr:MAG: hypothetical protein BGO07_03120 [Alphaproteobacteria bacterium 40-19]